MDENGARTARGGVERVLRVLAAMAALPGPIGARALARHVDLPDSTVYRLLATLRDAGFVTDLGRDAGFVPGPVCARLGAAPGQARLVEEAAAADMQALSARTRETVGLMMRMHRRMTCLRTVESPQSLRCSVTEGAVLPLDRGASARTLLAFSPPAVRRMVAQDQAPERRAPFLAALDEVARTGHAVSDGEVDGGVWGVSVPLLGPGGHLHAGLTLMAPSSRAAAQRGTLIALTVAAGRRISARLSRAQDPPEAPALPSSTEP